MTLELGSMTGSALPAAQAYLWCLSSPCPLGLRPIPSLPQQPWFGRMGLPSELCQKGCFRSLPDKSCPLGPPQIPFNLNNLGYRLDKNSRRVTLKSKSTALWSSHAMHDILLSQLLQLLKFGHARSEGKPHPRSAHWESRCLARCQKDPHGLPPQV